MSPIGQRIEQAFQRLSFEEQLELLPRLLERISKTTDLGPKQASFSSEAELKEKAIEGINCQSSPMTESDWNALGERITGVAPSSA